MGKLRLNKIQIENLQFDQIRFYVMFILCAIMPLHSMVIDKAIGNHTTGLINLWRDVLIFILLLIFVYKKNRLRKFQKISIFCIFWILINAIISIPFSNTTIYLALNMSRIYIMPIILYLTVSSVSLSREQYSKLINLFWIQGVILTIFGIVQVFVLGSDFLINLGYGDNGSLNYTYYIGGFYGFQRMVSTFSSANDCGLYLSGLLTISIVSSEYIHEKLKKVYPIGLMIMFLGIVLTFSRTSIIAVTITAFVYFVRIAHKNVNLQSVKIYGTIFLALLIVGFGIDILFLNMRVSRMIASSFSSTVSKTDASFLKHLEDMYLPMFDVLKHPFGYWFGTNGPVALSYLGRSHTHLVESSYWLIGYELGFFGMILYFHPIFYFAYTYIFGKEKIVYENAACALAFCDCIAFLMLPYVASFEMPFLMFLFMGLNTHRVSKKNRK